MGERGRIPAALTALRYTRCVNGLGGAHIMLDDAGRLKELADYRVLDTPDEEAFDNITRLTAQIVKAPIALVSLVDEHRLWYKSRVGLTPREIPREGSFCTAAISAGELFLVPDASTDERFKTNPLVACDAGIRFYCGVPLHTPRGDCLGTLCVLDRVPRSLAEADLSALAFLARQVELELEIRRRLALVEEALEEQQHRRRSTGLLATMVVHDLRGPLSALTLLAATFVPADEDSREARDDMIAEGERMRRMLTDILDICLDEIGGLRPRRKASSVETLVRRMAHRMERLTRPRRQSLALELPDVPLLVYADPELLERVLENLVGNAIHHGPSSEPITVAVRSIGARLRVEVRDRGEVIPLAHRESIFGVFERLAPVSISSQRGYGLGLAFCRIAIEAHGGSIGVSANPDRGNCFYFEIPLDSRVD